MCNSWSFKIFFTAFILYLFFFFCLCYLMVNKVDDKLLHRHPRHVLARGNSTETASVRPRRPGRMGLNG